MTFMPDLQALQTKINKLQRQAEVIARRERAGAVARVVALMDQYGLTVADLPGATRGSAAKAKTGGQTGGVPKYRDPATGKTWTGHGRAPEWIKGVANRDDVLIHRAAQSKAASSSATNGTGRRGAAKAAAGAKKTRGTRKVQAAA